jgi:Mg2+/Co2+ transporter CorB
MALAKKYTEKGKNISKEEVIRQAVQVKRAKSHTPLTQRQIDAIVKLTEKRLNEVIIDRIDLTGEADAEELKQQFYNLGNESERAKKDEDIFMGVVDDSLNPMRSYEDEPVKAGGFDDNPMMDDILGRDGIGFNATSFV